jgi:hypothetical protein
MRVAYISFCLAFLYLTPAARAQSARPSEGAAIWNTIASPVMDAAKSARIENVVIQRDRVKITLENGNIHFAQPANGVVFGAVFRGSGRIQAEPPNPTEAHQLRLFADQDRLDMTFTEATFSFTDGFFEEVDKQVQ